MKWSEFKNANICGNEPDVKPSFKIGDLVYIVTDSDQNQRIVTGIMIRNGLITYAISLGSNESYYYDFEVCYDRDVLKI